jgi:hypothetical protein
VTDDRSEQGVINATAWNCGAKPKT